MESLELNLIGTRKNKRTASIDRIYSKLGYVVGNLQWIHKTLNKLKTDMDQEVFIDFAKNIHYHSNVNKEKYE